jgi:hypothetical protein
MTMPREIWVFRYHPTNEIPRHRGAWDDRVSYRAKSDVRYVRGDVHDKAIARAEKAEVEQDEMFDRLQTANQSRAHVMGMALKKSQRADRAEALLKEAVEALRRIASTPAMMTWGEDSEVREAMRIMEEIADATLAKIKEAKDNG